MSVLPGPHLHDGLSHDLRRPDQFVCSIQVVRVLFTSMREAGESVRQPAAAVPERSQGEHGGRVGGRTTRGESRRTRGTRKSSARARGRRLMEIFSFLIKYSVKLLRIDIFCINCSVDVHCKVKLRSVLYTIHCCLYVDYFQFNISDLKYSEDFVPI